MNTIRRTFIAGLMAIVVAAATIVSPANEAWPYDNTGDLLEYVDAVITDRHVCGNCECKWQFKCAKSYNTGVGIVHFVFRLMAQAEACGELDIVAYVAGRKGWYFENTQTGEIVPATAEWFKGLYMTYKEYYENESDAANNG